MSSKEIITDRILLFKLAQKKYYDLDLPDDQNLENLFDDLVEELEFSYKGENYYYTQIFCNIEQWAKKELLECIYETEQEFDCQFNNDMNYQNLFDNNLDNRGQGAIKREDTLCYKDINAIMLFLDDNEIGYTFNHFEDAVSLVMYLVIKELWEKLQDLIVEGKKKYSCELDCWATEKHNLPNDYLL